MKELLFALLFVSTVSILADPPLSLSTRHVQGTGPIAIDGLVYSQTYSFETLLSGYSIYSGGNRWLCDDFELDDNYYVTGIRVWIIWIGGQASMMNLVISVDDSCDSDPNTNTDVWVESVPCTNTFTGDSSWGYDIYDTYCTISADAYPDLDADLYYHFETQADISDNCFILVRDYYIGDWCWYDDGSGAFVRIEYFGLDRPGMFFDFYGEPVSALEPETWGSIKTLF
ncbi:MAG: hypothetical protein K8R76_03005 [Candidatus Aegiribacteria sp.]|nr:hypothetical protein [Candidatus Aegiribacteria sp.]